MNSERCPDALLPDGPTCPRCGGNRAPSGVDGGSWVHYERPNLSRSGWANIELAQCQVTSEKEVIAYAAGTKGKSLISYDPTLDEMHAALSELKAARAKLNAATAKIKERARASERSPADDIAYGYKCALDDIENKVRNLARTQPLQLARLTALGEVIEAIDQLKSNTDKRS